MSENEDWTIRPMTKEEYYHSRGDEIIAEAKKVMNTINSKQSQPFAKNECKQIMQNLQNFTTNDERERMFKLANIMKK
jgi:hypothetical protein